MAAQLPGYYLTNVANIVLLPVIETHEAELGEERGDIELETAGGKRYVYNQFKREIQRLTFHVNSTADLAKFRTMHDTVAGVPFYYRNSDGTTYYVRKQKDFVYRRERGLERFTVTLDLSQEPTDAEINA